MLNDSQNIDSNNSVLLKNGDHQFWLSKDKPVNNLKELRDELDKETNKVFLSHISAKKNDYADWIRFALDENEIADEVMKIKNKKKLISYIDGIGGGKMAVKNKKSSNDLMTRLQETKNKIESLSPLSDDELKTKSSFIKNNDDEKMKIFDKKLEADDELSEKDQMNLDPDTNFDNKKEQKKDDNKGLEGLDDLEMDMGIEKKDQGTDDILGTDNENPMDDMDNPNRDSDEKKDMGMSPPPMMKIEKDNDNQKKKGLFSKLFSFKKKNDNQQDIKPSKNPSDKDLDSLEIPKPEDFGLDNEMKKDDNVLSEELGPEKFDENKHESEQKISDDQKDSFSNEMDLTMDKNDNISSDSKPMEPLGKFDMKKDDQNIIKQENDKKQGKQEGKEDTEDLDLLEHEEHLKVKDKDVKTSLKQDKNIISKLEEKKKKTNDEINKFKQQQDQIKKAKAEEREFIKEYNSKIKKHNSQIIQKKNEIDTLKKKSDAASKRKYRLAEKELKAIEDRKAEDMKVLNVIKQRLNRDEVSYAELKKSFDEKKEEFSKFEEDLLGLKDKVKQREELVSRSKQAYDKLKRKLDSEMREKEKIVKSLEKQFEQKNKEVESKVKELEKIELELEYKSKDLSKLETDLSKKENKIHDLEISLDEKEKRLNSLYDEILAKEKDLNDQEKELMNKENDFEKNIMKEKHEIEKKEKDLDFMRKNFENELKRREDELKAKEDELKIKEKEVNISEHALDYAMKQYTVDKDQYEDEEFHKYLHNKLDEKTDHEKIMTNAANDLEIEGKYMEPKKEMEVMIDKCKKAISEKDVPECKKLYNDLRKKYYDLDINDDEKELLHNKIRELYDEINLIQLYT